MNPLLKVIGLMSGTSLDGLDIALVEIYETRGNFHLKNTNFKTYLYDEQFKLKILKNLNLDTSKLDELSDLNFELGNFFAEKVIQFCHEENINISEIDLIGSHGQTFFHNIKNNHAMSTLQLADGSVIAQKTGVTTVSDFRPADIAMGGHGAPLVPFLDYALFKKLNKNIALQNIGGIANFTYISAHGDNLIAFDTGPGNMIIDSLVKKLSDGLLSYDQDGQWAAKGQVNNDILNELLKNNYFDLKPPKSTGRELFGQQYSDIIYQSAKEKNILPEDLLATVTYFVAKTIFDSYNNFLPQLPEEIVVSGGGARNLTLMNNLKELFISSKAKTKISTLEDYQINSDAKEAVAFALLAYCTVFGLTNNLPKATGAKENVIMGKISPAKNYNRILLKNNSDTLLNNEVTETRNILSYELDELNPIEIVELMNQNDYEVVNAVNNEKDHIAEVLEQIIISLESGGKLFYTGAGTSGRLGVLDASECPPTFKTDPELVQGIIAGGQKALTTAVEGAEDSGIQGRNDIKEKISAKDILIGISANGKAPYVMEALNEAKNIGAKTVLLTCNKLEKLEFIDYIISVDVGAEILSGSTRLKAGTATKMVLNMFTTGAFAKLGKVYSNYMVDLNVSNKKLEKRAINIIKSITKIDQNEAENILNKADGSVKLALLMQIKNIEFNNAKTLLEKCQGSLRKALNDN
ncbi:MAG: anhydro-N-acetylmuramic acid kinase [Candidatus Sericytochromatia bacterium]|nr:anhydro-N-acetylmuramic acid kinase [Candidatus Sericytochromatia bacterium]